MNEIVAASPPKRRASAGVAEEVYQKLTQLVMQNDVEPGSRIVIDQLASQFGVSSTPVREALAQLEIQGLVTKERLRGYRYAEKLTAQEFDELWDFRLLLEPNAARLAAARITLAGKSRLTSELSSVREPGREFQDDYVSMRTVLEHDLRFHDLILELAGNSFARRAIAQANVHTRLLRLHFEGADGGLAVNEHAALVDAIIEGDTVGAEAAMQAHLEHSFGRIRPHIS